MNLTLDQQFRVKKVAQLRNMNICNLVQSTVDLPVVSAGAARSGHSSVPSPLPDEYNNAPMP